MIPPRARPFAYFGVIETHWRAEIPAWLSSPEKPSLPISPIFCYLLRMDYIFDGIGMVGGALIFWGLWLLLPALAIIFAGLLMVAVAITGSITWVSSRPYGRHGES